MIDEILRWGMTQLAHQQFNPEGSLLRRQQMRMLDILLEIDKICKKVGEEALELVIEACNGTNERMIYEGSDMIYHLIVLLTSKGLRIEDLAKELQERHNPGWKKH